MPASENDPPIDVPPRRRRLRVHRLPTALGLVAASGLVAALPLYLAAFGGTESTAVPAAPIYLSGTGDVVSVRMPAGWQRTPSGDRGNLNFTAGDRRVALTYIDGLGDGIGVDAAADRVRRAWEIRGIHASFDGGRVSGAADMTGPTCVVVAAGLHGTCAVVADGRGAGVSVLSLTRGDGRPLPLADILRTVEVHR